MLPDSPRITGQPLSCRGMTDVVPPPDAPLRYGYRVNELVARTTFSERHIRRLIATGVLDTFRVGNNVFITPESVDRLFAERPR